MKKLQRSLLNDLFAAINACCQLYLPLENASGQAEFSRWREGAVLSDKLNTARSAKDLFFPQVENLAGFRMAENRIEILETREEVQDFVLFGVRACDAAGFAVLDRVFLSDPVDTFYQNRREHGLVITMACGRPERTCFCSVFGIDAASPAGDITCWMDADTLYWQANTEKGHSLTAKLPILEDCGDAPVQAIREKIREDLQALPLAKLSPENFGAGQTKALFDRPEWKELSSACLGCGTCTFVCPTCQCYDIQEFNNGSTVRRFRCWDSCMYSDFTMMSAGQPRPTQLERFRQRFMHKLVYFPENNDGVFGCVGCGRCLRKCPVHMNIAKVIRTLGGDVHDA